MPRCIAGFPLHVTVKHASMFRKLAFSLVKNWRLTPVKYAFSPGNVGHIEHLKEWLPGKVWESDKSNWDFMFHGWIADATRDVVKALVIKPADWDTERLEKYFKDVDGCWEQVFHTAKYRTSDGTEFSVETPGIMKSGWFMTIAINSIAQLVVHVDACITLGLQDEQILSTPIFVGGDDVNQQPLEGVTVEEYVEAAAKSGVDMEVHERDSLEESEYFSNDIRMNEEGFTFHPKRWTKHIEHLKVVKIEDLGDALCSHMENYRHDVEKFNLLTKMYLNMQDQYPAQFPTSRLRSRELLVAKQRGYEALYME